MKAAELKVGERYEMRVSGASTVVEFLGVREGIFGNTTYRCRNIRTGREILARSPQRFRRPLRREAVARLLEIDRAPRAEEL